MEEVGERRALSVSCTIPRGFTKGYLIGKWLTYHTDRRGIVPPCFEQMNKVLCNMKER